MRGSCRGVGLVYGGGGRRPSRRFGHRRSNFFTNNSCTPPTGPDTTVLPMRATVTLPPSQDRAWRGQQRPQVRENFMLRSAILAAAISIGIVPTAKAQVIITGWSFEGLTVAATAGTTPSVTAG